MIGTNYISHVITDIMIENKTIEPEESHIYQYCFNYFFDLLFNCTIFFIIAFFAHEFLPGALFTCTFLILRSYGGGIHAPSEWLCTLSSFTVYGIALWLIPQTTTYDLWLCPTLFILSSSVICILSPVNHKNKQFNAAQRLKAKKHTLYIILIVSLLFSAFYFTNSHIFYRTLMICNIVVSISMVLGRISNRRNLNHGIEHSHL